MAFPSRRRTSASAMESERSGWLVDSGPRAPQQRWTVFTPGAGRQRQERQVATDGRLGMRLSRASTAIDADSSASAQVWQAVIAVRPVNRSLRLLMVSPAVSIRAR